MNEQYLWISAVVAVVAAARSLWSPCGLSMLTSITPFGERSRGHRYPLTAAWFVAGALLGGAVLGAVCAGGAFLIGLLPPGSGAGLIMVAAVVAVVCLVSDLRIGGLRLPVHPRQVDETWLRRYRRWVYAAGFGVQIGSGFATYIMTGAVYLTAVTAVLSGSPVAALLLGLLFGLVRGVAVLLGALATSPDRLRRLLSRIERLSPVSVAVAVGVQAWAAVALGGLAAGTSVLLLAVPVGVVAGAVCLFAQYRAAGPVAANGGLVVAPATPAGAPAIPAGGIVGIAGATVGTVPARSAAGAVSS
ncbi:hypothetical protein GIS00_26010 [Nakamurella sp. YIM 132087]|uniref:Sulfite exporter TauE/SafE family protein n=1 Tax=Nakamurella alba TaxID=2665158 RepID=A0A7K1FTE1_9ACTN|nr:hypothetical protein [Nakamurella alba]MTD17391.1 hypothetical protein [Nakamurella alba]